jgi:hypothetical protein
MMRLLPLFLLLSLAAAAKKPAAPAEAPSDRWRYPATCAEMEPIAFDVMKRARFVPNGETLEDWAIVYHWARSPFGWLDAKSAVQKYTAAQTGWFDRWYEVQITGTDLRFIRESGGRRCLIELHITYSGFRSGVVVEGVYGLPSNQVWEHTLLKSMGSELEKRRAKPEH